MIHVVISNLQDKELGSRTPAFGINPLADELSLCSITCVSKLSQDTSTRAGEQT